LSRLEPSSVHSILWFYGGLAIKEKITVIGVLLFVITLFHYSAPHQWYLFHTVMGHAYVIPIIIASYWFALKGGLISSIAAGILFSPHIPSQFKEVEVDKFIGLFVYAVIGAVTGILSGKLQKQAEEIYDAGEHLHATARLSSLGELAASVAHEIRNPLGAIKGAVEILQDDFPKEHEKYEFFEIISAEVKRLNRIVEEFLGLARPRQVAHRSLNLLELIRAVSFLVSFKAKKRKVQLAVNIPGHIQVTGDPDLLKQAFLNIFLNAVESIENGGTVSINARDNETDVLVEVADTGPGIPTEVIKKMFKPFFTTKGEGTGLGLSIANRIFCGHGGSIAAESHAGDGTVMKIRLPKAERDL